MKDNWLERKGERFVRYRLHTIDSDLLYLGDGQYTRTFALYKYWGEDDNWKPWGDVNTPLHVTIESLLSEFTLIGSINDKYVKGLEELRDNNFKKETKTNINLFTDAMAAIQSSSEADGVYAVANNGKDVAPIGKSTDMDEQIKQENERHTEDIHTLHSGESETDSERPAEGVQE